MSNYYVYRQTTGSVEGEDAPSWEVRHSGPYRSRAEAVEAARAEARAHQGYYSFLVRPPDVRPPFAPSWEDGR